MGPDVEAVQQSRKHIFAVNGDPAFLYVIRQLLQEQRFNVTTTNFVPRTFEQVEALQPDLIIIDLVIGEHAGWDLLEQLTASAETKGIPVILTSTDQRLLDEAKQDPRRYGGQSYITKPLDLEELLSAVCDLVGVA